jgi:hypothetical protein
MRTPCRVSNAKAGRVPALGAITPTSMRRTKVYVPKLVHLPHGSFDVSGFVDHSIAWKRNSSKFAEQYNSAVLSFDRPCLRRYLEFIGARLPPGLPYQYAYTPPSILGKPSRAWSLVSDDGPVATFTNVVEAYLVMKGFHKFGDRPDYHIIYTDFLRS